MLAHIGLYVDNLATSDSFYRSLLASIGYEVILSIEQCIGYGKNGIVYFEIYTGKPISTPLHIAFDVPDKQAVEQFYSTAIRLGAKDNGKPGYRNYFPNYYAAFIIDPNGHNLEAVSWKVAE